MRQVTIYTTDKDYQSFISLAKNLKYVKKIETDDEPTKEEILANIKAGLEEVDLAKVLKENISPEKTKLSDKYRGVFSKEDATSFNEHTKQMREEW